MNQITIAGNLGADPEVRVLDGGRKVTTLRVAARVRRAGDETAWWKVTVWGDQFDKMIAFLKKGSSVVVTGEMNKPEIYNDRAGQPQISLGLTAFHVSFSPFGGKDGAKKEDQPAAAMAGASSGSAPSFGQAGQATFSDDEIPF